MNNLILAFFTDDFFLKCLNVIRMEKTEEMGIITLRNAMTELHYDQSYINAVIKRLRKKGLIQ